MNAYSIHDRATVHKLIMGQLTMMPTMIDRAIRSADNKYRRTFIGTSKYQPHQGKREIARRAGRK